MTPHQLGQKRYRKALRRKRLLEQRMRAYGDKSVPAEVKFSRSQIKKITKTVESLSKPNWWQRLMSWLKKHYV